MSGGAGLLDAWSHQVTSWPTVGEQLAHLPDGTVTVTGSTGTLAEAEAAARADAVTATVQRHSRDEDSRLHVVLLRGRSIRLAGGAWHFEFDTGETRTLGAPDGFGSEWFAVSADIDPGSGQIRFRVVAADFWGHDDELTLPRFHANPAICLVQHEVNGALFDADLALPLPPQAPAGWGMGNWMHELVDGRPVHGGEGRYALDGVPVRAWWPEHLRALATSQAATGAMPLPAPRLVKTAAQAESYAAEVLRAFGFRDARATSAGADGGIDVIGTGVLAQVKMEGVATGRPVIQALYGNAALEAREGIVLSLAGCTRQALAWAERAGVACFEFTYDGAVEPRTARARTLLAR